MQTRKIACFLSILLLFSGSSCTVGALSNPSVSFHGVGITINLTFPEEAHPLDNISHNITITAKTALTIQNFTIFIYAPVNSSWQEVKNQTITSFDLLQNQNLTSRIGFILPQKANGTLYCFIYVLTDQSADYFSTTFYTTHVSILTFTEMQSRFNELLSNYTILQLDYDALLQDYDGLLANYSGLLTDYEKLLNKYNSLSTDYNSRVATYETLLNTYNSLSTEHNTLSSNHGALLNKYDALQSDYDSLNSTRDSVQASYDSLNIAYRSLNQTYVDLETQINKLNQRISLSDNALSSDKIVMFIFIVTLVCLIALIAYSKRKKTEPYIVIRKETVTMKPDEGSTSESSARFN
jgi:uncharacterized protein YoxC